MCLVINEFQLLCVPCHINQYWPTSVFKNPSCHPTWIDGFKVGFEPKLYLQITCPVVYYYNQLILYLDNYFNISTSLEGDKLYLNN